MLGPTEASELPPRDHGIGTHFCSGDPSDPSDHVMPGSLF